MALGTMTKVDSAQIAQGPVFYDRVTLVGDGAYGAGGSTGVKAKLQAITKDGRVPFAMHVEDGKGLVLHYDVANEKLMVYTQDGSGALAEASGDLSANTFKLAFLSK